MHEVHHIVPRGEAFHTTIQPSRSTRYCAIAAPQSSRSVEEKKKREKKRARFVSPTYDTSLIDRNIVSCIRGCGDEWDQ